MAKLIDADDFKNAIIGMRTATEKNYEDVYELAMIEAYNNCIRKIDDAKAIDDVPVIRCKQCKFFRRSDLVGDYCENDDFYPVVRHATSEDDYCSFAERR